MMDTFARMLALQEQLQRESFGYNFETMTAEQRIQYIKDMKLALEAELQEALDETGWKPWATRKFINRDAYFGELVDVLHFLMNMFLVLGDNTGDLADEIFTKYCLKNHINERRQREGYDGISTKCGGCGRALDDPAVSCRRRGDQGFCTVRNVDVNYVTAYDDDARAALRRALDERPMRLDPIKPTRDTVTP